MSALGRSALLLLGLGLAALAWGGVVGSGFLSDDFVLLDRIAAAGPFGAWSSEGAGFFRPLVSLSLHLDRSLWGLEPAGFHATGLLLHLINSVLTGLACALLAGGEGAAGHGRERLGALAALLFLILPAHTEAVSWISGRTDLIATAFFLGSFCAFLRHRRTGGAVWLGLHLGLFALALLSKESAIVLPAAVLVCELFRVPRSGREDARDRRTPIVALAGFGVLLGYLLLRFAAIGELVGGYGAGMHLDFSPARIASSLPRLASRALLQPLADPAADLAARIAVAVLLPAGLLLARLASKRPLPRALWISAGLFLVCLLPVLNLGLMRHDTRGERALYLASVFSTIFLVLLLGRLIRSPRLLLLSGVAIAVPMAASLWAANRPWREAGGIVAGVTADLRGLCGTERVVVLDLPDSIEGAYILRNGLPEALALEDPSCRETRFDVVAYSALFTPADGSSVSPCDVPACVRVELTSPAGYFLDADAPGGMYFASGGFRFRHVARNAYELLLEPGDAEARFVHHAGGRMREVTGEIRW